MNFHKTTKKLNLWKMTIMLLVKYQSRLWVQDLNLSLKVKLRKIKKDKKMINLIKLEKYRN